MIYQAKATAVHSDLWPYLRFLWQAAIVLPLLKLFFFQSYKRNYGNFRSLAAPCKLRGPSQLWPVGSDGH